MRVLLTGNLFHNYEYSIKKAFEQLGHEVILHFLNFEGPYYFGTDTWRWLKYGFLPAKMNLKKWVNNDIDKYNDQLKYILDNSKIDIVLVIKGLTIDASVFDHFSGAKVLWVLDSIKRFVSIQKQLSIYDKVFSYEPTDLAFAKASLNQDIEVLSVGFDPDLYYPIKTKKIYQMSFVGGRKPNREQFIAGIIDEVPIKLIGDFNQSSNRKMRAAVIKRRAQHHFINQFYNQTYINLNIHKPQSVGGVNPRFYEIMGSGNLQMVEHKPLAEDFIDNKHLVYYASNEECLDKTHYYLNNSALIDKIRIAGFEKVVNGHTWKHRIKHLLNRIEKG